MNKKRNSPSPRAVVRHALGEGSGWKTDEKADMRRGLAWFVWMDQADQEKFIAAWQDRVALLPNFGWMGLFEILGKAAGKWPAILKTDDLIKKARGVNGGNGRLRPAPAYKHTPLVLVQRICVNCSESFSSAEPPLYCPLCQSAGWQE